MERLLLLVPMFLMAAVEAHLRDQLWHEKMNPKSQHSTRFGIHFMSIGLARLVCFFRRVNRGGGERLP